MTFYSDNIVTGEIIESVCYFVEDWFLYLPSQVSETDEELVLLARLLLISAAVF